MTDHGWLSQGVVTHALWAIVVLVALFIVWKAREMCARGVSGLGMGGGLLISFVLLTILSGAAVLWKGSALGAFAYIVPIVFLFIAIGAFLLLLLHYAQGLHEMKPDRPVGALGLPEGSVRAFLTIGLLSLVAVFGTFIFFESGKAGSAAVHSTVPIKSLDDLATIKSAAGDRVSVVPRQVEGDKMVAEIVELADGTRNDIAKQLLTMITTVLTTVIGFYFGTRTTESAGGASDDARRRDEAGRDVTRLTEGLDERERRLNELVMRSEAVAGEIKTTSDTAGAGEAKVADLKAKLAAAIEALRGARNTTTTTPNDTTKVLEAQDAAKRSDAALTDIEGKLKAFVEKKDPAVL